MSRAEASGARALLLDYRNFAGAGLWLALAIMLLAAVAEGFGLLMIVPLASIAIGEGGRRLGQFAPWVANIPSNQRFLVALALFIGAMAARSALLYARDVQTSRLETGYERSLRLRAAATLAARGWSFAGRIGQAGMQSLLLNDVPRSALAINYAQQFAISLVMLVVQLALTAVLSPSLTLVAVAVLVAGGLGAVRWMRRGVMSGIAIHETATESADSGFRLHAGLKAALAQGTIEPFLAEYGRTLTAAASQMVKFTRDYSAAQQLAAVGAALAAALLLFVGVRILHLPFPVLLASLVLFARMSGPAQRLQQAAQNIAALAPSFAAIRRRLGELVDAPASAASHAPLQWSVLTLDAAGFEHQPGLGLSGISIALKPGEWIGLAGPSGVGKTTLVDLVAGLLRPNSGSVRIDGAPLDDAMLDQWRAGLAYVGQDGNLFNDSVRGNLLAEGAAASDDKLWQMLDTVGLGGRIRAFPSGLDESVGDRGSQLSGGERQRLVIARALLREPSLLILDEATAALDPESEAALLERLRSLKPKPAALLVAHRETTLAHCDSVLRIQHGKRERSGD
jgi:ATP-binding cassette subfamily C protein